MKEIYLLMILVTPNGPFPTPEIQMSSLQECIEKAQERAERVHAIDADYVFTVGCQIRARRSDEANSDK